MPQEGGDQLGVELADLQFPRRCPGFLLGVAEEEPPGVSVAGDRVRTRVPLRHQAVGEETLQEGSKRGHGRLLTMPAARSAACGSGRGWSSSRRPGRAAQGWRRCTSY